MMKQKPDRCGVELRRARLGICVGQSGEVYVADPQSRAAQCYVLRADSFIEGVRSKRIVARHWTVVVPRRDCLLKHLCLPATADDEIRRMLEFELPGMVPTGQLEMCHDFLPLWVDQEECSHVVVVSTPVDRIETATAPLLQAGITPNAIMPSSLALFNWLNHRCDMNAKKSVCLSLCIDERQCQTLITAGGRMLTATEFSITRRSDVDFAVLVAEAERFLKQRESHSDWGEIAHILLAGEADLANKLALQIEAICTSAAGSHPSYEVVGSGLTTVFSEGISKNDSASDVSAMSALGACFQCEQPEIARFNLLPASWGDRRRRRQQWIGGTITAGMVVGCLLLFLAYLAVCNHRLEVQREAIMREIEPIRDVAADLETKKRQVRIIRTQMASRALPLDVLLELYDRVPSGLSLSQLTMDMTSERPELVIRGSATSLDSAFSFPLVLEESALFSDVRSDGAQQVSRGRGILVEFGCRCRINTSSPSSRSR